MIEDKNVTNEDWTIDGKPILLIFEGVDRVGKSTTYQAFRKATQYQPLVIDRFIGSNYAYDLTKGRRNKYDLQEYLRLEQRMRDVFYPLVVYLTAPVETLFRRTSDEIERKEILSTGEAFTDYLKKTALPVKVITTHDHTVEEVVKETLEWIRDVQDRRKRIQEVSSSSLVTNRYP